MTSFSDFPLDKEILSAIKDIGISIPTEVQEKSIPLLLEHKGDFICRSATGTGKTFAFGIPLLSRVDLETKKVQGIVLVPTRELCIQVEGELNKLSSHMESMTIQGIYGGVSLKSQKHTSSNGVHIIVATPGRLLDLIGRKVIHLDAVEYVVFDEADEMLSAGFKEDMDKIIGCTPKSAYHWLFSATMPDQLNKMIGSYMNNELEKVFIGEEKQTNTDIKHYAIKLDPTEKLNVLLHFLNEYGDQKGILFCRTKSGVQKLHKQLSANGFSNGAIHGSLPQGLRNKVMEQFREGHIQFLIATDVASRGVDVADIGFVIQYHIPDRIEAYTHRSGRTSRAGREGTSLTFYFKEEQELMDEIKSTLKLDLELLPIPSKKDQGFNNAIIIAKKIAKQSPNTSITEKDREEFFNTLNHMSKKEILEKLMAFLAQKKK